MTTSKGWEGHQKQCSSCGELKHEEEFHRKSGDRREGRCKVCLSIVYSNYYQRNREEILSRQKERYAKHGRSRKSEVASRRKRLSTVSGRATELLRSAKRRAKEKGLPCILTKKWVIDRLGSGVCQETGMSFDLSMSGGRNKLAPSIDRHDLEQGYTPINCRVVIWAWNCARGQYGTRFLLEMVDAFQGRTGLPDGSTSEEVSPVDDDASDTS